MKKSLPLLAALCVAAFFSPVSHAQDLYVGSNSSGVTTNFTSGTNPFANTYIGFDPGANSNTLNVLNTNTVLSNSAAVFVGVSGSSNRLVVSNGGKVLDSFGYIGWETTASNNSVLVSGPGSRWSGVLHAIGQSGSGNSLVVSNGGRVLDNLGSIGDQATSSNNRVLVTGTNSLWSNSANFFYDGSLYVGFAGSGNNLVISNGGTVAVASNSYIGFTNTSSNNSVLVAGSNSLWTNSFAMHVGNFGSGNSLVISNEGKVASFFGIIGISTNSSNNSVLVTGTNSLWTNSSTLYVGYLGSGNSLTISNGGTVADLEGFIGI